jgi:hypothetical protein
MWLYNCFSSRLGDGVLSRVLGDAPISILFDFITSKLISSGKGFAKNAQLDLAASTILFFQGLITPCRIKEMK